MKILTAAEMAEADRVTAERFAVPFPDLMEHAGLAVSRFVLARYPQARRIVALCGTGNNGGDGLVAAHHLQAAGLEVSVLLTGDAAKLQGAAAEAYKQLVQSLVPVGVLPDDASVGGAHQTFAHADVVLDAVVGTGFKPPLRGVAAVLQQALQGTTVPVVSIDLPSGWDADSQAQTVQGAFRSDAVVTFTTPKLAHVFGSLTASNVFGPVVVAPIGSPDAVVESTTGLTWTGTSKRLFQLPRPVDSNKGMYGHVLLIGGAFGKSGAPAMAALAALRTGAGLVTAAVPQTILNNVAAITPELMTVPLDEDAHGSVSLANFEPARLQTLLKKITVLAIGPGLGIEGEAPEFVQRLIAATDLPLVLDADALNAFKGRAEPIKQASHGGKRTIVLTPHPGEMGTLLGISTKEVQADRLNLARRFATEHCVTLVLKGWRTLVAHPDGEVSINTTGNPAMAKGGSGDILTGIVAACLAQHPENVRDAVNAAVYLHGLAADFAAHRMDEHTVLATDTAAHLSDAFRYRTADADGAEWICGLRMP